MELCQKACISPVDNLTNIGAPTIIPDKQTLWDRDGEEGFWGTRFRTQHPTANPNQHMRTTTLGVKTFAEKRQLAQSTFGSATASDWGHSIAPETYEIFAQALDVHAPQTKAKARGRLSWESRTDWAKVEQVNYAKQKSQAHPSTAEALHVWSGGAPASPTRRNSVDSAVLNGRTPGQQALRTWTETERNRNQHQYDEKNRNPTPPRNAFSRDSREERRQQKHTRRPPPLQQRGAIGALRAEDERDRGSRLYSTKPPLADAVRGRGAPGLAPGETRQRPHSSVRAFRSVLRFCVS
jgi:hypothetical protein